MTKTTRARNHKRKVSQTIPQEATPARGGWRDGRLALYGSPAAFAIFILLLTSVVTTWPTWRDGHATYLDNPAHLAEIHSLAFEAQNGWSQLAYCGYPLGSMHSPIWYGLLTVVARTGMPVEPLYALLVWLGFVAPALALFFVARKQLPVFGAASIAMLVLLQRPVLLGLGSATGGMWTSYLGAAGVILLADRISRPCRTTRSLAGLAAIVALTALTHLYTLLPMLVLGVVHAIRLSRRRGTGFGQLVREAGAGILGALVASMYWVQPLLVRSHAEIIPNDLSLSALLARLLLPLSLVESRRLPAPELSWLIDAAPMVLLVGVGLMGIPLVRKRQTDLPLYGLALLLFFALVLVLAAFTDLPLLGNYSWRMLYYVRVGLALTAIPFLAMLLQRVPARKPTIVLASLVAVVAGLWFSQPLDRIVLRRQSEDLREIRASWRWLRDNQKPSWGRVYVQGTFGAPAASLPLSNSHILALTARESNVEQLGAFYGGMPIRTTVWTTSEFGRVFGRELSDATRVDEVLQNAFFSNSTHLLISDPRVTETLVTMGKCDGLFRAGTYAVLAIRGAQSNWLYSGQTGVRATRRATGYLEIEADANYAGGNFLVKEAFHPFWTVSGSEAASLQVDEMSRLITIHAGPGPFRLEMRYEPPRWPLVLSLMGVAGLALLTFYRRRSPEAAA